MAQISANNGKITKGCKPLSPQKSNLSQPISGAQRNPKAKQKHKPNAGAKVEATRDTHTPTQIHGCKRRNAEECSGIRGAKRSSLPVGACRGVAGGGYGGQRGVVGGGAEKARGPLTQTQSGFILGDRVRNESVGVWGIGTIVGIIPADVNPRWYCRHKGYPMVFDRRSERVGRERYIVFGDDGRHHVPRKIERVGDGD